MIEEKKVLIEIGLRFEKLRKNAQFTSYEHFAIENNLSRMHYWKIENGKANITIRTLVKILNIHSCSIEDFFNLNPREENDSKKMENTTP